MSKKQIRQVTCEEMKSYGEYFKSVRASLGLSLEAMSQEVGTFRTTISKWEKGESVPQVDLRYVIKLYKNIIKKNIDHLESLHSSNI